MDSVDAFQNKYRHALRPRAVRSTVVKLAVGGTDLEARLKQWEKRYRIKNGKKPFARIGKLDFSLRRFRQFMGDLSRGGTYSLDGTAFSVPNTAPLSARKALTKGTYEKAERDLVREWLPADLPAIELGGSYGIVSHTIRTALSPDARLVVVEANPALIETCTANLSLAGQADRTKVVAAALAYGDARTVRFAVTEAQHTSHVTDNADEPGGTIEVPAVTLAGLLKTEGIDGPFSLVCDIEGAELALLRNEPEVLKSCACLVMELHPQAFRAAGSSLHEVTDLIGKAGLEIVEQREQVIVARPR